MQNRGKGRIGGWLKSEMLRVSFTKMNAYDSKLCS